MQVVKLDFGVGSCGLQITSCEWTPEWTYSATLFTSLLPPNTDHVMIHLGGENCSMGPLQFTITWYKNRHAGEQTAHWDLQNKRIFR